MNYPITFAKINFKNGDGVFVKKECEISFQIEGKNYILQASKYINDEWNVGYIGHDYQGEAALQPCPYCGKKGVRFSICSQLEKEQKVVFEQLIQHPSIRTKCVFEINF